MTTLGPSASPPRRPSDLEVEQWRLGELDGAESQRVARALQILGDPRARSTQAEDRALFERLPPEDFELEVLRRVDRSDRRDAARARAEANTRGPRAWALASFAVLAVALVGLGLWLGGGAPWSRGPAARPGIEGVQGAPLVARREVVGAGDTRIKGQRAQVIARVKRGSELRRVEAEERLKAGDLLQVSYVAAGHAHGVIVSIDGRGGVTLHLPAEPTQDTRLAQGKETPIGHSYELDDAPGFERFIFVAGDTPLDPGAVLAAARALARGAGERVIDDPLELSADLHQSSVVVRKAD